MTVTCDPIKLHALIAWELTSYFFANLAFAPNIVLSASELAGIVS